MAQEYYGDLVRDPVTGKVTRQAPQPKVPALHPGYLLPESARKVVAGPDGMPVLKTTVDYMGPLPPRTLPAMVASHGAYTLQGETPVTPSEPTGMIPTGISGYFGSANNRGKIMMDPQSGKATGGFSMNEDLRKAEVERQSLAEAEYKQSQREQRMIELAKQASALPIPRSGRAEDIIGYNQAMAGIQAEYDALKGIKEGGYKDALGRQALASVRKTEAELPFVGKQALANIGALEAQGRLYGAQAALQPYIGAAKALEASKPAKTVDMSSMFKDIFAQMSPKQQAALLPLIQQENWAAVAQVMQNPKFIEG